MSHTPERAAKLATLRTQADAAHARLMVVKEGGTDEAINNARIELREIREEIAKTDIFGVERTKDEWDAMLAACSQDQRYQIANLAAHNWAIQPGPDGSVIASGQGYSIYYWPGGAPRGEKGPISPACTNCKFTGKYLSVNRGHQRCHIDFEATRRTQEVRGDFCCDRFETRSA